MGADNAGKAVYWARTVGAPTAGDPRDGELHQGFGEPRRVFHLEPWDNDPKGEDARYVLDGVTTEADGREVWIYRYSPD